MANRIDNDETARYEPSHQDLHCLHRYWFWSAGMKGLGYSTLWGKASYEENIIGFLFIFSQKIRLGISFKVSLNRK